MSIDKSLSFKRRVGLKGGADAATASFSKSAGSSRKGRTDPTGGFNLSGGQGPTFGGSQASQTSGRRGRESRQEFIDNLNRNNASRFEPSFKQRTCKPVTLDTVGSRNQRSGFGLQNLIGLALGIPMPGMFKSFRSGLTSLGDKLGDFREKTTGYRTQEEYDNARQQRINLKRINTIQNTLNRKYSDGDYSNTDLDERLAALKSQMGIVPNTAEQNAQQFLDFNNDLAINTIAGPSVPNQAFGMPVGYPGGSTYDLAGVPTMENPNIPNQAFGMPVGYAGGSTYDLAGVPTMEDPNIPNQAFGIAGINPNYYNDFNNDLALSMRQRSTIPYPPDF